MVVQIYAIECIPNGFVYVGCTKHDLAKRCREHMSLLKRGKHGCSLMLHHFKEHGRSSFEIRSLEILAADDLKTKRDREISWMRSFGSRGKLYNETEASFGAGVPEGRKRSPEANLKRRLAQLGKPKGHGAKVSASKKALGQRPSLEAARAGGRRSAELGVPSLAAKIGNAKRKAAKLKI